MHYYIDGHNLIGKIPDISLSDPDDEIQLVLRLRQWAAARRKRKITVIFDGGMPGGKSVNLSTSSVRVVFASEGRTADALLIVRIRKAKNPREYQLVTSDQQIIAVANKKKMPVIRSEKFAMRLSKEPEERLAASRPLLEDDPVVSKKEVAEWMDLFGPVPKRKVMRKKRQSPPQPKKEKKPKVKRPLSEAKHSNEKLDDDDIAEWLALFGGDDNK
ncbi:MAG: NYN domain-containing protein [Chloroflexi bacterium]|nr:NYN domain-containing protein [Chloroflexota bacterium]